MLKNPNTRTKSEFLAALHMLTMPGKSSTGASRSDNHLDFKRFDCWALVCT